MSAFDSWQSYSRFSWRVKRITRYIFDSEIKKFLNCILKTSKKRVVQLPENKYLWRAQLGHDWKPHYEGDEHVADVPGQYLPERMKPLPLEATEGRANPKGIPFLYLASEKETAMAEVRPWLGAYISVGQFKTTKDLTLIDCSQHHGKSGYIYCKEPKPQKKENAVWRDVDNAFSKPTIDSDKTSDYVPTQIIAELFKQNGYDGIIYKSSLEKGYNVVLFDIETTEIVNCALFELKQISFIFEQSASFYSI